MDQLLAKNHDAPRDLFSFSGLTTSKTRIHPVEAARFPACQQAPAGRQLTPWRQKPGDTRLQYALKSMLRTDELLQIQSKITSHSS